MTAARLATVLTVGSSSVYYVRSVDYSVTHPLDFEAVTDAPVRF